MTTVEITYKDNTTEVLNFVVYENALIFKKKWANNPDIKEVKLSS